MASVLLHTVAVHRLLKENSCRCQAQLSLLSQMVCLQCRAVQRPARKWLHYRFYPKQRKTQMYYRNEMNLPTQRRLDNVQGSNLFLQFLKWPVKEPDRCPTRPKYNSKSERWPQVKSPAMMGSLVPLVLTYKKWTCLTSKEAVPAMGSALRAKENQLI